MRLPKALLLCPLLPCVPVWATFDKHKAPSLDAYCFYAINQSLAQYTFSDIDPSLETRLHAAPVNVGLASSGPDTEKLESTEMGGFCSTRVQVVSLYAAALTHCGPSQFSVAVPYWKSLCETAGSPLAGLDEVERDVTRDYAASLPALDPSQTRSAVAGNITSPVLLSKSYYDRAYKSYISQDYAIDKDKQLGWGLMGFWGAVLFLGMTQKAWTTLWTVNCERHLGRQDSESGGAVSKTGLPFPSSGIWHRIRTYLVIPAVLAPWSSQHQRTTLPRRLDSVIIICFWALLLISAFVGHDVYDGSVSTPIVSQQAWQFAACRTGIFMISCLPFLWLFAGRNNIFLWATPFSYRSFSLFHRTIATAVVSLAIVHGIAYTVVHGHYKQIYSKSLKKTYFRMGLLTLVAISMMVITSHSAIRTRAYEAFLITHIVLAILIVYALSQHLWFAETWYYPYFWPIVAIWSFDRFLRLVRIACCNWNARLGGGAHRTQSVVKYYGESDMLRIEVTVPRSAFLIPGPGQYYYIYQPFYLKGWENHPFTLGAFHGFDNDDDDGNSAATVAAVTEKSQESTEKTVREPHSSLQLSAAGGAGDLSTTGGRLVFYVRPFDGWTRKMRKACQRQPESEIRPRLLVEGPYGRKSPLHLFEHILFIVGGTGVSAAVPYMLEHQWRSASGATKTCRIHLAWSARQRKLFDRLARDELRGPLQRRDVRASLFCTGKAEPAAVGTNGSASPCDTLSLSGTASSGPDGTVVTGDAVPVEEGRGLELFVQYRRPDVSSMVAAAVEEARAASASVAVMVCGPPQMADDSRAAVYSAMTGGFKQIEYFEDTFGW